MNLYLKRGFMFTFLRSSIFIVCFLAISTSQNKDDLIFNKQDFVKNKFEENHGNGWIFKWNSNGTPHRIYGKSISQNFDARDPIESEFSARRFISNNFDIFNFENINLNAGNASVSLLKEGCFIDSESVVFNKHAALRVGNFNTKYKYVADYDFFIKMGRIYEFNYTTQIVSKWRIHDQQATIKLEKEHTNELIRVLSLNILSKSTPVYLKFLLSIRIIKQIIKGIIKK